MIPKDVMVRAFKYECPTVKDYKSFKRSFDKLLCDFLEIEKIDKTTVIVNERMIIEILIRIDQRRDYYLYFHSGKTKMIMAQDKFVALMCFWIVKYKPLTQDKKSMQDYFNLNLHSLNESFALFLIKNLLFCIYKKQEQRLFDFFNEKNSYIIKYNLAHRDLSKESLILFVLTLIGVLEL